MDQTSTPTENNESKLSSNEEQLHPEVKKEREFKKYLETYTFKMIFFVNIACCVLVANYILIHLIDVKELMSEHLRSTFFIVLPLGFSLLFQPLLKDFRRSLNRRGMYIFTGFSILAAIILLIVYLG